MKLSKLFLLGLLAICALPLKAQTQYEVVAKQVNVFAQPSTNAQVLGQKVEGDILDVYSKMDGWACIKHGDGTGFVDLYCIKPLDGEEEETSGASAKQSDGQQIVTLEDEPDEAIIPQTDEYSSWEGGTTWTKSMIDGEGAFVYNGFYYIVLSESRKTVALVRPKNVKYRESSYVIPGRIQHGKDLYTVTEIAPRAFELNKKLTNIVLPETLEAIGFGSFAFCTRLANVSFPQNLKYIGTGAFNLCKLSAIILPESIEEVAEGAFMACDGFGMGHHKMGKLYVPCGIRKIGKKAFSSSRIKTTKFSIQNLPDWVTPSVAREIGIHEDSFEEYMRRKR